MNMHIAFYKSEKDPYEGLRRVDKDFVPLPPGNTERVVVRDSLGGEIDTVIITLGKPNSI